VRGSALNCFMNCSAARLPGVRPSLARRGGRRLQSLVPGPASAELYESDVERSAAEVVDEDCRASGGSRPFTEETEYASAAADGSSMMSMTLSPAIFPASIVALRRLSSKYAGTVTTHPLIDQVGPLHLARASSE